MHIRSRISSEERYRARERRAWGSLGVTISLLALSPVWAAFQVIPAIGAKPLRGGGALLCVETTPTTSGSQPQPAPLELPALPPLSPELVCEEAPLLPPALAEASIEEWDEVELDATSPLCVYVPESLQGGAVPMKKTERAEVLAEESPTPPAYAQNPQPPYPAALRAMRAEGDVRVRIAVDAEGKPQSVEILSSSGYVEFDHLTRSWILQHWRFTPARCRNQAIAGSVTTSVRFVMR